MKLLLLKTFSFMSNFLFWLWVILGTPLWIFGVFFDWDTSFFREFIKSTIIEAFMFFTVFAILYYLRKLAKKLLEANPQ